MLIGTRALLEGRGVDPASIAALEPARARLEAAGKTVMLVAVDGRVAGLLAVADTIKSGAAEAIARLQGDGIAVWMVTGDNRRVAASVAAQVSIPADHVLAEVLPGAKAEAVHRLQEAPTPRSANEEDHRARSERRVPDTPPRVSLREWAARAQFIWEAAIQRVRHLTSGKKALVAFVGDGINDAPAPAQADVGIALGTGADIAMETADATLVQGSLRGVVTALELSRATMRIIQQNLFWAFAYNSVLIPLAIASPAIPWLRENALIFAATAMALSSVTVVSNSLRLRGFGRSRVASKLALRLADARDGRGMEDAA
jgi:Cu+-exporting ATPase